MSRDSLPAGQHACLIGQPPASASSATPVPAGILGAFPGQDPRGGNRAGADATRRAVEAGVPGSLVIEDLRAGGLPGLGWSGTAAHLRSVANYLARSTDITPR